METREEFVIRALAKEKPFSQLCAEYDVSRKNGGKWVERYREEGVSGLKDRSRRPKSNNRQINTDIVLEVCRIRHTTGWGCGKNLRPMLLKRFGDETPSARTIDRILLRAGFVEQRKRRRIESNQRLKTQLQAENPNDIWTTDFKGWWFTQDKRKCQPFTLRDQRSRNILALQGMRKISWEAVQEVMTTVFQDNGLPEVIRSDNGSPFASHNGLLGLTRLSAWWVALGIKPDRIEPGHPEQNGGHERMHRDLKRQLQRIPELDLISQQSAFDAWRAHFNNERPHSALAMQTPSEVYTKSRRRFIGENFQIEYPQTFEVRKVDFTGCFKRRNTKLFLSTALAGWDIGLESREDGSIKIWLAELCLGQTDSYLSAPVRTAID